MNNGIFGDSRALGAIFPAGTRFAIAPNWGKTTETSIAKTATMADALKKKLGATTVTGVADGLKKRLGVSPLKTSVWTPGEAVAAPDEDAPGEAVAAPDEDGSSNLLMYAAIGGVALVGAVGAYMLFVRKH